MTNEYSLSMKVCVAVAVNLTGNLFASLLKLIHNFIVSSKRMFSNVFRQRMLLNRIYTMEALVSKKIRILSKPAWKTVELEKSRNQKARSNSAE